MIKTIAVCDKCHCYCEGDYYFTVYRKRYALIGGTDIGVGKSDICERCYDKMLSALKEEEV